MKSFALLAAVAFVLHFVWERAHIGLYTGYEALEGFLPVYVFATLGDLMYTLLAVGLLMLFFGMRLLQAPRVRQYALLAVMGLCVAIFVEVKAAMLGRWEYTSAMPLIHGLGLSPLIQMTVLLPLSVFIVARLERWLNNRI